MSCSNIISTTTGYPGAFNLTIYQGATFNQVFTWYTSWNPVTQTGTPIDLTSYTGAMVVAAGQTTVVSLTTSNGGIALGGTAGTVTLSLSATATAALSPVNAQYDLLLTSGSGVVTPLIAGACLVRGSITG